VTLQTTIAAPFRHTRKKGMRKNEIVYFYALDRKWMSSDQATSLLKRAEEDGLLKLDNGVYTVLFDPATIPIPIGFKPSSAIFTRDDPMQELISQIAKARGVQETEIVAEMNKIIKEQFDGNLLPPAALVLMAKKYGVSFTQYLDPFRETIKKGG